MSDPVPSASATPIPIDELGLVLNDPARWRILRELAKGKALPVSELGRRVGRTADSVSKHMIVLRQARLVVSGFGRLYELAPGLQPPPGVTDLDLGYCVLRLDRLE